MSQDSMICLTTTDAVLPGVIGMLPPGLAWDTASIPGTTHNKFWRAISGTIAALNGRLCAYVDELFCDTAIESLDQWYEEYHWYTDDLCNPWTTLCKKVLAEGGQSCSYYVTLATDLGWSITCSDLSAKQDTLPIAGCMMAGCAQLGPPVVLAGDCFTSCNYGPAANYPDKTLFPATADRSLAICAVPGSVLGTAQCCLMAGQYTTTSLDAAANTGSNCGTVNRFTYPMPRATGVSPDVCLTDTSGFFQAYTGYAHRFQITIDVLNSTNPQKSEAPFHPEYFSQAGCIAAGCFQPDMEINDPVLCFLETIKPAHTTIEYKLINV